VLEPYFQHLVAELATLAELEEDMSTYGFFLCETPSVDLGGCAIDRTPCLPDPGNVADQLHTADNEEQTLSLLPALFHNLALACNKIAVLATDMEYESEGCCHGRGVEALGRDGVRISERGRGCFGYGGSWFP
jgi:hypothetical protein